MAGEVNFSGKLAKSIDLSSITVENLDETKKKEIEKIFNTVTGGNSATTLTTDELVVLSDADTNHDGKITDAEAKAAYDKLADDVKQGLTAKQVTQNDYVAYLKAMAKKNEELIAQESNVGNGYTVQLGEDLDDLLDRIIEANKVPEDKKAKAKEDYKKAILAANKNNGAIKFDENGGVKWLVAGAKIILPTMTQDGRADKRVKDQNNKSAVENKYRAWRAGKIQSFRYSINADGQASEVRASGSTNFDVTKDYDSTTGKQDGVATAGNDPDGNNPVSEDVETLDMTKIILAGKITEEDCVDTHDSTITYDLAEVKAKAEKGREILAKLNNPENIKSCTAGSEKYDNNQVKWYTIEFNDGSEISIHMSESGDMDGMYTKDSEGNDLIRANSDGKLYVEMNDQNDVFDVKIKGAVKDFDKLAALAKQSNKVREALGLPSTDFVNFDKIIDDEMPEGVSASDVKDKVKLANAVITKLENPSEVKEVKSENKDGGSKELTIKLKDDTIVKAEVDKEGKVTKVTVQYKDSSEPDVTYDLKNGNITVKIDDQEVETTGVINEKGKEAIGKFVLSAKTAEGKAIEEAVAGVKDGVENYESDAMVFAAIFEEDNLSVLDTQDELTSKRYDGDVKKAMLDSFAEKSDKNSAIAYLGLKALNEKNETGAMEQLYSSDASGTQISNVLNRLLDCAEKYGVTETDCPEMKDIKELSTEYYAVKGDDHGGSENIKNCDELVKKLIAAIDKKVEENNESPVIAEKDNDFDINNAGLRATGTDIQAKYIEKIQYLKYSKDSIAKMINKDISSSGETIEIMQDINEKNIYWVINGFKNPQSENIGIIESIIPTDIKGEVISTFVNKLLDCAKKYGLENTSAFRKVDSYAKYYGSEANANSDLDNRDVAKACDNAIAELMALIKNQAGL